MKTQYQSWQEKSLTYGCLLRGLIINAVIFVALGAGILWVMSAQNMIQGPWASLFTVAFVILGVMFAFFQWFFPRSPIESKTSIYTSETTITPTYKQALVLLNEREKSELKEGNSSQRTGTLVVWTTEEKQTITVYLLNRDEFLRSKTGEEREKNKQKKIATITGEIFGTQLLYIAIFRGLEPGRYSAWKQTEYGKDKPIRREIQIHKGQISFRELDW